MQERLQEIVFKNPTRIALILTTMILSSQHDKSRCLQCIRFLPQLRQRMRHIDLEHRSCKDCREKNTTSALLLFPKVWFANKWDNEKMFFFFSKSIFWRLLPWSKSFLLLWVTLSITIFVIKRNIVSRWLPKYLKQWRLFVDSAILHWPWLYYQPYLLCQPSINISSPEHFVDQPWNQKHAGWWYQSTKKKSSLELEKLLTNIFKKND